LHSRQDFGIDMKLPGQLTAVVARPPVFGAKISSLDDSATRAITGADTPEFSIHVVPSAEPPTGMGEPGLPPLAPAFANAVARLTGKPVRELPFKLR
jgi:isoquinoline 1-oxidoreductase beta subunit